MADAPDIQSQIYSQIWAVLNAYGPWAKMVPGRNQIRYDQVSGAESPAKPQSSDGDYPSAELLPASQGMVSLQTFDPTFGTFDPGSVVQWNEKHSYSFPLVLISELLGEQQYSQLCANTVDAIRRAGAQLGLPQFVIAVKVSWRSEKRRVTDDVDTVAVRFRTDMAVMVDCVVDSADVLGT